MRKLLWKIDKERKNDLAITEPEFNEKVAAIVSVFSFNFCLKKMDFHHKIIFRMNIPSY